MIEHVAIVGAGFSGSLAAINLVRHGGPRATVIERRGEPGQGLAYGAAHPAHLLNVRASNMSAFPDQRDHFVAWLRARGGAEGAADFVPRTTYGDYVRETFETARRESGGRLEVVTGTAEDVILGDGVSIPLADGRKVTAEAAILALGNLPPHPPATLGPGLVAPAYFADPWDRSIAEGLAPADTVLILGTGLTMVDVVLKLDAEGFAGRILAVSRRGLLPRAHAIFPSSDGLAERPRTQASALLNAVRGRAARIGWRAAVDELRPYTQSMWQSASEVERGRFLRHLRPWWDVHRHRIAPPVAARLAAMQAEGRLSVIAATPLRLDPAGTGVRARLRPRGGDRIETADFARAINATGPQGDLLRTDDPLLKTLVARGTIRPDGCRLGIDVTSQAETIAASGQPNQRLLAIGPMTRGSLWEIVAVPDIREQAWTLARRLSNAHWVGGEGL